MVSTGIFLAETAIRSGYYVKKPKPLKTNDNNNLAFAA